MPAVKMHVYNTCQGMALRLSLYASVSNMLQNAGGGISLSETSKGR